MRLKPSHLWPLAGGTCWGHSPPLAVHTLGPGTVTHGNTCWAPGWTVAGFSGSRQRPAPPVFSAALGWSRSAPSGPDSYCPSTE